MNWINIALSAWSPFINNLPVLHVQLWHSSYRQSVQCSWYVLCADVRFCESCKCIKPDRAHHCSSCRRSVMKPTVNLYSFKFNCGKGILSVLSHFSASEHQDMLFSVALACTNLPRWSRHYVTANSTVYTTSSLWTQAWLNWYFDTLCRLAFICSRSLVSLIWPKVTNSQPFETKLCQKCHLATG